jgi:hypothetical protein
MVVQLQSAPVCCYAFLPFSWHFITALLPLTYLPLFLQLDAFFVPHR